MCSTRTFQHARAFQEQALNKLRLTALAAGNQRLGDSLNVSLAHYGDEIKTQQNDLFEYKAKALECKEKPSNGAALFDAAHHKMRALGEAGTTLMLNERIASDGTHALCACSRIRLYHLC